MKGFAKPKQLHDIRHDDETDGPTARSCPDCHCGNPLRRHKHFLNFQHVGSLSEHLRQEYTLPLRRRLDEENASADKQQREHQRVDSSVRGIVAWYNAIAPLSRNRCADTGAPISTGDAWEADNRKYPKDNDPWRSPKTRYGRQVAVNTMRNLVGANRDSLACAGYVNILANINLDPLMDEEAWADVAAVFRDFHNHASEEERHVSSDMWQG